VLIAWLGSTSILWLMAAVLALASCWRRAGRKPQGCGLRPVPGLVLAQPTTMLSWQPGFVDRDTTYNRVIVFKGAGDYTGRLMRS
jgi:hypothetical protein